jgi:hypothetical protein
MARTDLSTSLRKALEKSVDQARSAAKTGAADAIRRLGVAAVAPPPHLDKAAKDLRVRLRAHARSLGDGRRADDTHDVKRLTEEAAYAHWHRLLFARFLLERRLLREPESGGEVTLDDCRELAGAQGLPDAWAAAERFAAAMLPGVFRPDEPVLALTFAPEHAAALQRILQSLDPAIFQADDSLGWTYQFWRAAEKDAVNRAGEKIGADSLPAVTQLFTEPYMVRFLLHNTLGAWWAGKVLAADTKLAKNADDETMLRVACALPGIDWEYLRFVKEGGAWRPACTTFSGWPREAKAITVMDPCCGSGHFLVEAFAILTALRIKEEKLAPAAATAAVLKDNLFGLELDGRCVQIASFAIALAAWRLGESTAVLPNPHIAWVGAPPPLPRKDFVALANSNAELGRALGALHDLFVQAPLLGSLLRPTGGDLADPLRVERIETQLDPLVARLRAAEPERAEGAIAARGMADAAELLARRYVLQATNVPYLGRGKQEATLASHIARHFPDSKADLATAMLSRMIDLATSGGTVAAVTPQNWLFLGPYRKFRERVLMHTTFNAVVRLGPRAFATIGGEVVNTALIMLTVTSPNADACLAGLDANDAPDPAAKANAIRSDEITSLSQAGQRKNPSSTITTDEMEHSPLLSEFAESFAGICTGDYPRFGRAFWELATVDEGWELQRTTSDISRHFSGMEQALLWENDRGNLRRFVEERLGPTNAGSWLRGHRVWGNLGISVKLMQHLPVTRYLGELFDDNVAVILPRDQRDLEAIYAYCETPKFAEDVRALNRKVAVKTQYLLNVPFDREHWRAEAHRRYPSGLPEPYSDDPTQWLFHGHPAQAIQGAALHVAIARLAGYRWPAESNPEMRLAPEARVWITKAANLPADDADGLLCLPAVAGERGLADRLRAFLAVAFGKAWSDAAERRLIGETDERFEKKASRDASLEGWLRDRAFRQHCALFHHRPFLWHVWDEQKDGFAAFVHYHRLTRANLEKLTFSLLGDWIGRMKADNDGRRVEAATILQQRLQAILEGEKPYDVFVRWKPLAKQPLGWELDLDDGVRMNIRPFVEAEVLRDVPNVKWTKDRGSDVKSAPWYGVFQGERINDHHTTLAEKRKARGLK